MDSLVGLMKRANGLYTLLAGAFIAPLVVCSVWSSMSTPVMAIPPGPLKLDGRGQGKPSVDPCWFMALKEGGAWTPEMLDERDKREMYGYPKEIPLGEAVRIFNEEKQCSGLFAPYPPLTEDELIAAIVAGPDAGKQGKIWQAQKDELWRIASQRVMPRGALLTAATGPRVPESPLRPLGTVAAKGMTITLLLGLDKGDGHDRILKPEQTLVIRKIYSRVETVR